MVAAQQQGRLTALALCTEPERVAQLIARHAPRLWCHLSNGGHVYVCGGASGFGHSVARAFADEVFAKAGGMGPAAAAQYLTGMLASERYLEDLSD